MGRWGWYCVELRPKSPSKPRDLPLVTFRSGNNGFSFTRVTVPSKHPQDAPDDSTETLKCGSPLLCPSLPHRHRRRVTFTPSSHLFGLRYSGRLNCREFLQV